MVRAFVLAMLGSVVLVVGLGACSGKIEDNDDMNDGGAAGKSNKPTPPSPEAQCISYATTWCNKAFGCYVQVGRLDQPSLQYNVDKCIEVAVTKLPCNEVASVTGDYDTCIKQIKGMACSRWDVPQLQFGTIAPPASCDNVLSFGD